jgi:hypothetical protein
MFVCNVCKTYIDNLYYACDKCGKYMHPECAKGRMLLLSNAPQFYCIKCVSELKENKEI